MMEGNEKDLSTIAPHKPKTPDIELKTDNLTRYKSSTLDNGHEYLPDNLPEYLPELTWYLVPMGEVIIRIGILNR